MKKICALLLVAVCFLPSGCSSKSVFKNEISEDVVPTVIAVSRKLNPGKYSELPNKKYGWGLKKNKNAPPDIPSYITDVLDKYGAVYKDCEPRSLYLTFDEGYENGYTAKILDVLKKTEVPAAFFVTGPYIKNEPELIKRMVSEGHIVGNHTINHPSMPNVLDIEKLKNEIVGLSESFTELTGEKMSFFRPPMGEYSERTLSLTQDLGLTSVFWSFAYKDWDVKNQKGEDFAYKQIREGVHDGAILLLHAVSEDNANVLERVINDLKQKGYRFKSLEDFGNCVNNN